MIQLLLAGAAAMLLYTPTPALGASDCDCATARDLQYRADAADPALAAMDIYYRTGNGPRPVLLFIHGGGWVAGDKANIRRNPELLRSFLNSGFVVASVNFRLVEKTGNSSISYRDMLDDIARSMKWLSRHHQRYHARPDAFVLLGYSSGAHLASLLATDERYLAKQGLSPQIILGVSAWDVPAYDIPLALTRMKETPFAPAIRINRLLFGATRAEQLAASPVHYLDRGIRIPFQLLTAGIKAGWRHTLTRDMAEAFKQALLRAGYPAEHHHYAESEHAGLPLQYGRGNRRIQADVERFLKRMAGRSDAAP